MTAKSRIVRSGRIIRSEEGQRKKIELAIEAKDFGPISGGKITLKPLTLFIGPNNSGKSYAAMLVHSIFESYTPTALLGNVPFFYKCHSLARDLEVHKILVEERAELKRQIINLREGEELEIPKLFLEKVTNKIFDELYEKRLSAEIVRSYACPLRDLIRIGKRSFTLKINFNSFEIRVNYKKEKLKIEEYPKLDFKVKIEASDKLIREIEVHGKEKEFLIQIGRGERKGRKGIYVFPFDGFNFWNMCL